MTTSHYRPGPIPVEGAAFDDFLLTSHLPPDAAPAVIERDRLHMSARPGFERKLLPLRVEPATGRAYSGGRYLLDTYENARAFADWVVNDFELDGTLILKRPDFAEVSTSVWRVLGAEDFKDIHTSQHVYRTEIWSLARPAAGDSLAGQWRSLRDEAAERGRSSLWFLYDEEGGKVSLVTMAERVPGSTDGGPDFKSIEALETAPSQGERWERSGAARKTFDRTHWVFTVWFPRVNGRDVEPALWPNSPPLPAPEAVQRAAQRRAG